MALQSQLFRGDGALNACLVSDPAHLTPGTRGPHVVKVQHALVLLDGAQIANDEIAAGNYGRSTAAAVLAYKKQRQIINFAYQTTADNIVGKMTIASLDKEMALAEARPPLRGCSTDMGGGSSRRLRDELPVGDARQLEFPPARLNVSIQEAFLPGETISGSSIRTVLLVDRANKLLKPFNLSLTTTFVASFDYGFTVGERDEFDVKAIRKAAEKAAPSSNSVLRVIFCHLRKTTSTATSQGVLTGIPGFKNFVLINKDLSHPDHGTLLHEMIHCSNDRFMNDIHDKDENSVYAQSLNRNLLKDEHARSLNGAFFKS